MNLNLADKVYIVTGGASGIGEAICRLIAAESGIVVIADRNSEKAKALANDLHKQHYQALAMQIELTDEDGCKQIIEEIVLKYNRIDGLINNAGTNDGVSLENGSVVAFNRSLQINLVHCYTMAHHALPFLKKSKGSIVNIGSKISFTGQGGSSGYAAGKGGINALTREWSVELLPYGIRVNAVIPAEVNTPQYASWIQTQPNPEEKLKHITSHIPLEKRFTTPEEIANMVAFLLSDVSSHTTGQIIFVDGGYTHLDRMLT